MFTKNHNHMMCGFCDAECDTDTDRMFCHFEPYFVLFYPPNDLENQNF